MTAARLLSAAFLACAVGCGPKDEPAETPPPTAVAPATAPAARGLRGRMTDPEGRPVAGAALVATPWPSFEGRPDPRVAVETTVADDGDFAFDDLAAGDWALACTIGGALGAPAGVVRVPDVSRLDVVLPFGATIAGAVRDSKTDAPLPGARVRGFDEESECVADVVAGADGKFEFLSRREAVWIGMYTVERDGRVGPHREHSDCVERQGEGERVELSASDEGAVATGASLSGVVTGPSGPVAGVQVALWPDVYADEVVARTATTDAAGRYAFADVPSGTAAVVVSAAGLVQADADRPSLTDHETLRDRAPEACRLDVADEAPVRHDVTLVPVPDRASFTATGRVVDPDGKPVAGARVVAEGAPAAFVVTGADGAFVLRGVPIFGNDGVVLASFPGFRTGRGFVAGPQPGATQDAGDVALERAPRVHGRVTSAGAGVAGARVVAVVGRFSDEGRRRWTSPGRFDVVETTTDGEGAYALAFPYRKGQVAVHAEAAGLSVGDVHCGWIETDSDFAADIVVHPPTTLVGRVVRAGTSEPAVGVQLAVEPVRDEEDDSDPAYARPYGPHVVRAVTGADGAFGIDGVAATKSRLFVLGGGAWVASETALDLPHEAPLVVEAKPALVLDGRLAWPDDAPARGVIVELRRAAADDDEAELAAPQRRTSANGRFVFRGLEPGAYRISIGWGEPQIRAKVLGPFPAGARGLRVPVESGLAIAGRIVRDEADATGGAHAWVTRAGRRVDFGGASVQRDGSFEIGGLDDGAYDVHVEAYEYMIAVARGVLAGGPPLVLTLERGLSIAGVATGPDGAPIAGVRLCARAADPAVEDTDWRRRATRSGEDGAFTLEHLPPGRWRIVVDEGDDYAGPVAREDAVFDAGATGVTVRCVAPPAPKTPPR